MVAFWNSVQYTNSRIIILQGSVVTQSVLAGLTSLQVASSYKTLVAEIHNQPAAPVHHQISLCIIRAKNVKVGWQ